MAAYKWKLTHRCDKDDVVELLSRYDFEETEADHYILPIGDWKKLDLDITKPGVIEAAFFWAGAETTEIYFDYLLQSGYLLGQLSCYLELMARDDFDFPEDEDDEDDFEEDYEEDDDDEAS